MEDFFHKLQDLSRRMPLPRSSQVGLHGNIKNGRCRSNVQGKNTPSLPSHSFHCRVFALYDDKYMSICHIYIYHILNVKYSHFTDSTYMQCQLPLKVAHRPSNWKVWTMTPTAFPVVYRMYPYASSVTVLLLMEEILHQLIW